MTPSFVANHLENMVDMGEASVAKKKAIQEVAAALYVAGIDTVCFFISMKSTNINLYVGLDGLRITSILLSHRTTSRGTEKGSRRIG